jgi:hypothetical protein
VAPGVTCVTAPASTFARVAKFACSASLRCSERLGSCPVAAGRGLMVATKLRVIAWTQGGASAGPQFTPATLLVLSRTGSSGGPATRQISAGEAVTTYWIGLFRSRLSSGTERPVAKIPFGAETKTQEQARRLQADFYRRRGGGRRLVSSNAGRLLVWFGKACLAASRLGSGVSVRSELIGFRTALIQSNLD